MWRVLIIDDDFQVLEGMKKSIPWERLEAEWVGEAMDGQEGLLKVKETSPDIIITDIYMPVMNGLEMIEQLKQVGFSGEIIILSGYSDFQYARQALRLQVSDYLSRPVTMDELGGVLERVIRELETKELAKLEQEETRRRLMMYEPFVQKEWLKSVVTGTLGRAMAEESMEPIDEKVWLRQKHLVMGIELMGTDRLSNLTLTDWSLFRFALANIICEVLEQEWPQSEFIELHSHHAAIVYHIPSAQSNAEARANIRHIGEHLTACMQTYLKLSIRIGIGSVQSDWRQLPNSTEEAFLDLLQQTLKEDHGTRLSIPDAEEPAVTIRPIKFYQELAEAIVYAKKEETLAIVDAYLAQLRQMSPVSPAYLQYLCSELWTILAYSLYSTGVVLDDLFPGLPASQEIAKISTIEELRNWLENKISGIASQRGWSEHSKHKEAIDFMIQYAHQHYAEDIALEDLSKQLYLTRNYLNRIFKKATGETFTNYLIRVRLEKAKVLLAEGKHMIYEIAEMVGYKNVAYFSSIFKKHYGMNPSELGKK
ncbi:response regulator transcription factor [Paenibacillus qinlingensis]|uniref:Two-component system response regulator YesN n=1 Tax=Paenibacillus qinlingensis TaxID=1837343 RepID=A0ABU1P501_9BACL|nr:response regulator transcription factor [Paenibacillus qinlingensis]MDR6554803.1 two-component system response regulator YesN [Paenibacillus qinlingensis]